MLTMLYLAGLEKRVKSKSARYSKLASPPLSAYRCVSFVPLICSMTLQK